MNKIPEDIVQKVLDRADIVEIVGDDVTLKKRGVNYVGLCPFHDDSTPSLFVNKAKGICKCFACGKGGNAITYYMEKNTCSFPETVRIIAKRYNIEVPQIELTPEQQKANDDKQSALAVILAAQEMLTHNLWAVPEAMQYLQDRKISRETAEIYGLGFAFDFDGLSRALIKKAYKEENIIASGMAYRDESKDRLKDMFWQRIMFPFYTKNGQIVGFTGRAINNQAAKYKNTGETILFTKGRQIWGLYQAKKHILKEDAVYIAEGQFDVMSMCQAGVNNVVGGSGTAFTDAQRKMLHGFTNNVIFIYDGDNAGVQAAYKNVPDFVRDGFRVRCVLLPQGKDPDEMIRSGKVDFQQFLKKNTMSYVDFFSRTSITEELDDYDRLDATKRILDVVAMERDEPIRDKFISRLVDATGYNRDELLTMLDEVKVPQFKDRFEPGFYGQDFAVDYMSADKILFLSSSFDNFMASISARHPWIYYHDVPSITQIQEISRIADRFIFCSPQFEATVNSESNDVRLMKEMFKFRLNIEIEEEENKSFIYWYIRSYAHNCNLSANSPEATNVYLMRCAEMISYCDQAVQIVNMDTWANLLGMKTSALKELIKPFANERKSKQKIDRERMDVFFDLQAVDTDRIPEYVENSEEYSKMLRLYGFYPLLNNDGVPVCYMFKNDNNSYRRVGDFYIEPLFHVYSPNKDENRRVIRINRLFVKKPTIVEWPSSVFVKLTSLQEMLINEGAYNFVYGDAKDYAKIWNCISYNFPKCTEIKVYGQQPEGCFIFANGIYHQVDGVWKFEFSDELGLMKHGDEIFYSPAFSKVNAEVRKDNDRFEQDRALVYTEIPANKRISFAYWADLMNRVYNVNDNGKWAIIYAVMCAFRSDIHPIDRLFTSVFFIGPTMSGKTQIAISIRSLFIKEDAPSFNLNTGTDAAFFSVLERFRDVPQVFEEYNDDMISDAKFQGLKSVTYDGDGKQKRKTASSNDIETSKVNAPVIILGQEAPQKDDNALTNRVVLCEVPKREDINSEEAQRIFQELKGYEKAGLSYLLLQVLELRPYVKQQFASIKKECAKELQQLVESGSSRTGDQARVINTVSLFLAMCKLLETYAPHLKLPFSYDEFLKIATDKVRQQVSMIIKTDKLAIFFNAIDYLIDRGSIKYGRDFKIERPGSIKLKNGEEKILKPSDTPVLYMNLGNIHKMYEASMTNGDKPLTLTTLDINLKSHSAYIGQVQSTRFRWLEEKSVPMGGEFRNAEGELEENMLVKRVMEKREKNTSAVALNYDILSKMLGIDFERIVNEPKKPKDECPF